MNTRKIIGARAGGAALAPAGSGISDEEHIFVCPDRDETGFTPSSR